MSNDKSRRILEKIVSHIDHTLEYCQGQTFESFMDNRMLQEACIFNLLQIGELSKLGLMQVLPHHTPIFHGDRCMA